MNKCYVYGHYLKNTNELFYVGKGQNKRMYSSERSAAWLEKTKDNEWYAAVIKDNLTTKEALDFELELIKNTPNLVNLVKSSETKEMSKDFLSMFYYDETSPTCLRYAKPSIGKTSRVYKQVNDVAGVLKPEPLRKKQRFVLQLEGKVYYVHRVVFALFNNIEYDTVIDHVDGNSTNNKISNLRQVPQKVNSRNISKQEVEKLRGSAVTGVTKTKRKRLRFHQYIASYYDLSGKLRQKEFSCYKHGEAEAFRLACEWRKEQIRLLNEQGAGYTDRHGT